MALDKVFGWRFQSTPSVWRETAILGAVVDAVPFQSTPSVWRETGIGLPCSTQDTISIHSLRVEGDAAFQKAARFRLFISIHSLRVEGDAMR